MSRSRHDDDSVDRLSHQYSPALFILFSVIVSVKQYVIGDLTSCIKAP